MLSKKIEIDFSKFFKQKEKKDKKSRLEYDVDLQTKTTGFAIGFLINLALGALIFSIGLVLFW